MRVFHAVFLLNGLRGLLNLGEEDDDEYRRSKTGRNLGSVLFSGVIIDNSLYGINDGLSGESSKEEACIFYC